MSPETATIIAAWAPYLGPPVAALGAAAAAWLVTKLPGPARDALTAFVHAKDVGLINSAAASKAAEQVLAPGVTPSVAAVVAYMRQSLPEVLAKVQPGDEQLRAIAAKAILAASAVPAGEAVLYSTPATIPGTSGFISPASSGLPDAPRNPFPAG